MLVKRAAPGSMLPSLLSGVLAVYHCRHRNIINIYGITILPAFGSAKLFVPAGAPGGHNPKAQAAELVTLARLTGSRSEGGESGTYTGTRGS
mmetsp:Transcript_37596/g.93075  ORF Transcript_37596/g.93075 Transcript_37596/m.93075 type:complete len:92 (+) Transcript_37596:213-488(+)